MRVGRIVSGGQTGVDRGALDFAISRGIEHGGWVPKGRKAEVGALPPMYNVRETETRRYAERTRKNVLDSDGTLIVREGGLSGGTALTKLLALRAGKPLLVIDISRTAIDDAVKVIRLWVEENAISVLNVAGPRESQRPGIYERTRALLELVFLDNQG
ncbi:MAG TPA: putative molybdenum carrier protein [Syntrophorhabdales bacterium]|nr:putative molybdenum carrier protein [Syntrophorhabdales bacterium]